MSGYQQAVLILGIMTVIFAVLENWKPEVEALI
jgi:hypothetical protein